MLFIYFLWRFSDSYFSTLVHILESTSLLAQMVQHLASCKTKPHISAAVNLVASSLGLSDVSTPVYSAVHSARDREKIPSWALQAISLYPEAWNLIAPIIWTSITDTVVSAHKTNRAFVNTQLSDQTRRPLHPLQDDISYVKTFMNWDLAFRSGHGSFLGP